MNTPLVSIVILNWNCKPFLNLCIRSVLSQTYPNIEFFVMDNASTDGSVEFLKENFGNIPLVVNPTNLGFSKAHNIAIRQSRGKYYMPLNPDVILSPDFVEKLVKALEDEEQKGIKVGSASGKIYFCDDKGNPTSIIYTTGHVLTKNRKPHNRGYKRVDRGQYDQREYIFGANGACPLYRRDMLEDVSIEGEYFDELFFVYGDDYDLGWRAQLLGWKCIYIPTAIAYHRGKGTGGLYTSFVQFQYARNRYLTVLKNDFWVHFLADLPYILAYEFLWQVYILLTSPRRSWAHLLAVIDLLRVAPITLRKRKLTHSRKTVSPSYMRSYFTGMVIR
jgi:GT2 family glycosyltransferase